MNSCDLHRAKTDRGGEVVVDDAPGLSFSWWSFTKTVLAACALRLAAQGKLSVDALIPGRPFTLRQLLQHRAGVPSYTQLASYHKTVARGDTPWTVDDMLDRVKLEQLDFTPGEGWSYSNTGYFFVRQVIERTVGAEISVAMQKLVIGPLGLQSVRLAETPEDLDATAWGNPDNYHPQWVYHGLLTGSASDAARLLHGLFSGQLLPPELLDAMKHAHPLGGAIPGRPWMQTGYGLGLMIGPMARTGLAIGHSGRNPGSVCAVYHFPECHSPCTVAAFALGSREATTEHAVDSLAAD